MSFMTHYAICLLRCLRLQRDSLSSVKPSPHQQRCRSNVVEANDNFFDVVAISGNNVEDKKFGFDEATFDFVERMTFQCKTRSTLLPKTATMSKKRSTLSKKHSTL